MPGAAAIVTTALLAAATACSGGGGLAPLERTDTAPAAPAERDGYYAAGPKDQQLDPANHSYFATVATADGDIEFELWPALAPQNVNAFVFLARAGFYDGLPFHRVIADFVVQGGDPLGTGLGGPGFGLPAELHADDPVPMRAASRDGRARSVKRVRRVGLGMAKLLGCPGGGRTMGGTTTGGDDMNRARPAQV